MKKIIAIVFISSITVFITLTVLWKFDIVSINTPQEMENESSGLDLDELLQVEYPRLGDNLETAHKLLGEVAFESEEQIDFYIPGYHKRFYVGFNPQQDSHGSGNIIDSMHLFAEGDKEKLLLLGEKLIPVGSSLIDESHSVTESENETFRYKTTHFMDEYFYEMPDGNNYAVVRISNEVSDLFSDTESKNEVSYKIEASTISKEALQEEIVVKEEEKEPSTNSEGKKDQQGDTNDAPLKDDSNELTQESFSTAAIQQNNELIQNPNFLSNASEGYIEGINVSLYAPIGPTIDSHMGQPDWRLQSEGGYLLMYKSCNCGLGVGYGYEEYPKMPVSTYYLPIHLSYEDIVSYLGEPDSEGLSETGPYYYLHYELGEHQLWFERAADESYFGSVTLK